MNVYAHADWTYNNILKLGVTASYDGASSIGKDATRMSFYPAADAVLMMKNIPVFNRLQWLEKLNVYANYALTGNSRFSSKYGKYYYSSLPFQTVSGLVRTNVPSTNLQAERDQTINLGFETSLLRGRMQIGFGYYDTRATNVIIVSNRSSVFGSSTSYSNDAELQSSGIELSLALMPVSIKDFRWTKSL